jgi:hypothetical protein
VSPYIGAGKTTEEVYKDARERMWNGECRKNALTVVRYGEGFYGGAGGES